MREISFHTAKAEMRFFAMASAVLMAIYMISPAVTVKEFALLGLIITGSLCVFHATTALSCSLQGKQRALFQVAVSVAVPLLLSLYFVKDTPKIHFEGIFGSMTRPFAFILTFILASITGFVSWKCTSYLDKTHPFRGFLIACTLLFLMCLRGYHGLYHDEDENLFVNSERAENAAKTGYYFGVFLINVAASYGAMLVKMRQQWCGQSSRPGDEV